MLFEEKQSFMLQSGNFGFGPEADVRSGCQFAWPLGIACSLFDRFVGAQQEYLRQQGKCSENYINIPFFLILWLSKYLAPAALGVSQALSSFDPAIINLPSLENCGRMVALAQSGLEL